MTGLAAGFAERFHDVHRGLFAARHDKSLQLDDRAAIERVLTEHGVPSGEVFARIDSGAALATIRDEHERYAASHNVWGVPTFVAGEQAVFVRLMDRSPHGADAAASVLTIERTSIPR